MAPIAERPTHPAPAQDMSWIPGGAFLMGSEDFYPVERPVRRVEVDGFWMDQYPITAGEFRRLSGKPATPRSPSDRSTRRLAGRRSRPSRTRLIRLPQDLRPRASRRRPQLVGVRAGRVLEEAGRVGHDDQRPRSTSRRAVLVPAWLLAECDPGHQDQRLRHEGLLSMARQAEDLCGPASRPGSSSARSVPPPASGRRASFPSSPGSARLPPCWRCCPG
jgi:Sulfatase-modifying factor enzyme 1